MLLYLFTFAVFVNDMSLITYITDAVSNLKARVDNASGDEQEALIVATRSLKEFNNRPIYFTDSEGSKDMNVNVTFGGTPDKIHDGIDSVLWTGSSIVGASVTFNDAGQNHTAAGATSVKIDNAAVGDIWQFAKGGDVVCSNYSAITLWVYIDKDWVFGDSIIFYGWDSGASAQVGLAIALEEYFDYSIHDTWQKIAIGLDVFGDLATSTIMDAIRMRIVTQAGLKGPKFYLDDIQIEETGVPKEFTVEPTKGTWLYVANFSITVVDAYDATLVNNSMPKISHSGFLGESSLTIGLQARRLVANKILFSATFKDLIDFMGLPHMKVSGYGSDGTDTWIKLAQDLAQPFVLKSEDADKFSYIVRDNLSGLKKLWISVACYEEIR